MLKHESRTKCKKFENHSFSQRFITSKSHQILTYLILCCFCTFSKYEFLWKNNRKLLAWYRVHTSNTMGTILCLVPVPTAQILHPDHDLSTRQSVRKQARWHPIFFQVFAKNSLIKNIFEEKKKFESRTWFFLENSSVIGVFWVRRGLQANQGTVQKSAKYPQPGNQKQLAWSNTAYFHKTSFNFKIKFCEFHVTMTKFWDEGDSNF